MSKSTWNPTIPAEVYSHLPELSESAVKVAFAIARYADKDGSCYPSPETISKETGLALRSVGNGLKRLEDLGLLKIKRQRGRGKHCIFTWVKISKTRQENKQNATRKEANRDSAYNEEQPSNNPVTLAPSERGSKSKKRKPANGGTVWAEWIDINRESGLPDPVDFGRDTRAGKQLSELLPETTERKQVLKSFLADKDPFLTKHGHALALLLSRVNAYRRSQQPTLKAQADDLSDLYE